MKYLFYTLLIAIRIECLEISCRQQYLFSNEYILPIQERSLFIGTNDSDKLIINESKFFNLSNVFTLPTPDNYIPIQVIEANSNISQFYIKLCILLQNNLKQYIIFCRDGFRNYLLDGNLNFEYLSNQTLKLKTSDEDLCEYFFDNFDEEYQVVCFSSNIFKIITINKETTEKTYNHSSIPNISQCKRLVFKLVDLIVVNYFQCLEWIIFVIFNDEIIWIIQNESLLIKEEVINVQYCLDWNNDKIKINLILQHQSSYTQISFDQKQFHVLDLRLEVSGLFYVFFKEDVPIFIIQENNQKYIFRGYGEIQKKLIKLDTNIKPKQIFIYDDSQLFLIYENKIKVIFSQGETIEYNYSLISFERIKVMQKEPNYYRFYNYFMALDKHILFFKIEHPYNLSKIYDSRFKYLFEIGSIDFFDETLSIIKCSNLNIIEQEERKLQILNVENLGMFQGETSTHQLFSIQKMQIFSNTPLILDGLLNDISDFKQLSDFCKIETQLLDSADQFYFIEQTKYVILSQFPDILIFNNCISGKIKKFQINYSKKKDSIIVNYDQFVILSEDGKKLFVFALQTNAYLRTILKFNDEIIKMSSIQSFKIILYFQSYLKVFSAWDIKLKTVNILECPIEKPILYYEFNGGYYLIQFQGLVYFKEQRMKSYFLATIPNLEIISVQYNFSVYCFICVLLESDSIRKYCFINNKLYQSFEYPLFDFQLVRPLQYQISQDKIVIALLKSGKKYLYVFCLETDYIISVKEIIEVHNFKFSTIHDHLIFYDKNNIITIKSVKEYLVKIENKQICNNIQTRSQFQFKAISIVNDTQSINNNLTFSTIQCCSNYLMVLKKNSFIKMSEQKQIIQFNKILQGRISNLVQIQGNKNYRIQGPFNSIKSFKNCFYYGELLCYREQLYFIILNDYENQFKIPLIQENQDGFIFISYLESQQKLLIVIQNQLIVRFEYFEKQNDQFILLDSRISNQTNNIKQAKLFGELFLLQDNFYKFIFLTDSSQVIERIDAQSDLNFFQGSNHDYLETKRCLSPCLIIFEFKQLKGQKLSLLESIQFTEEQVLDYLIKVDIGNINFFQIQVVSTNYIDQSKYQVLLFFSKTDFSFLSELIISESKLLSFQIRNIIRHNFPLLTTYLDSQFFVGLDQYNSIYRLFDLRDPYFFIDSIYESNQPISLHSYNTTHYILTKEDIVAIVYIDYEIKREGEVIDGQNTTILVKAFNELSYVEFNLTIQEIENTIEETNNKLLISIILVIIIIFALFLFRRQRYLKYQTVII